MRIVKLMARSSGGGVVSAVVLSFIALAFAGWLRLTLNPPGGDILIWGVLLVALVTITAALRDSR